MLSREKILFKVMLSPLAMAICNPSRAGWRQVAPWPANPADMASLGSASYPVSKDKVQSHGGRHLALTAGLHTDYCVVR